MHDVIWDMGGTLVDTYPQVDAALAHAVWGEVIGPEKLHLVRDLRTVSIEFAITTLAQRYGIAVDALEGAYAALKQSWRTHPAPLMDGAREVMAGIHAHGGLNLIATHRDRTSAQALLDALGVQVDDMVCAPDGIARKPSPAMNLLLVERHQLDPAQVLCVGDRAIDVAAAENAGLASALLVKPGEARPDTGDAPVTIISSLRDLLPLIN